MGASSSTQAAPPRIKTQEEQAAEAEKVGAQMNKNFVPGGPLASSEQKPSGLWGSLFGTSGGRRKTRTSRKRRSHKTRKH